MSNKGPKNLEEQKIRFFLKTELNQDDPRMTVRPRRPGTQASSKTNSKEAMDFRKMHWIPSNNS
jgi:hypothetical protein